MIPKAQYPVSLTLQVGGSLLVVKLLVCVLSAVQFDDEPVFKGGEVCNVLVNGILATEFDAVESSGTQVTPQAVFCIRHVLPQCARVVLLLGIAVGGHGFCWVIGLGSVKGCSGFCRCAACLHPLPRPPPLRRGGAEWGGETAGERCFISAPRCWRGCVRAVGRCCGGCCSRALSERARFLRGGRRVPGR